ncbi:hypothetical protein KKB28_10000, partial [bacterium]|nr:hypothetical protein [bacterium]
ESSHAGVEWGWRLFDRMIISAMGAGSRSKADSLTRYASRASIQFPLGPLLLEPQAFIYQPNYFNGSNNLVEDREGYAASLLCPLTQSSRIVLATGQVEDDIEKTEGTKTILQWQRFDFTAPRVMRDMELLVTGERLTPRYEASHYLWTVNGKLGLPLDFKVFGMTTWGDEFSEVEGRNLIEDLGITDAPRSRRVGWEANLYRPLLKAGSLTLTHSEMSFRKRTYLTHTLQARGRSHIQWRLQGGYDWEPQTPFGQGQINYNLDRSGTGTIGVLARLQRNEWVFGVTLSLQPTFGFVGGKPILVSQSRLSPKVGGLKGQVFLDSNGNGLRESGEPGIGGVEILTNTGQRITPSRSGKFILTPRGEHSRVRVQLNPATVPAFYAATNGAQWAELEEGALTRVNLGLVILNSISGKLVGPDSHDSTRTIGIGMVRIMARTAEGNIAKESITSGSGSYYLGELKPGDYRIEVDERTLPAGYYSVEGQAAISLHPEGEPIDLESINLQLGYIPPPVKEEKKEEAPIQKKEVEYQRF